MGDVSNWDVSNVTDMYNVFMDSQFNGDIDKWDISNVTDFRNMFSDMNRFEELKNGPWKHIFEMEELLSI